MNLVVISVPYALAQSAHELSLVSHAAASVWQQAGLVELVARQVERALWVSLPPPAADQPAVERVIGLGRQLADTVQSVVAAGYLPLVLGGDCFTTSLGVVAGLQLAGIFPAVAWFDAHGDFNTPTTSPSGLLVGMPLAMLAGRDTLNLARAVGLRQAVPEWHILLAGPRSLDPEEKRALEDSNVAIWHATDLHQAGAQDLGRELEEWPPVYLHIDLDVLDPESMPAVEYPAPGGLAIETVAAGIESVTAAGHVAALTVTGFDPTHDPDGTGLATSFQLIELCVRLLTL